MTRTQEDDMQTADNDAPTVAAFGGAALRALNPQPARVAAEPSR
jgi:hypothetical protein